MTDSSHPLGDPGTLAALYAAGAMSEEETSAFEAHLTEGCVHCSSEVRRYGPAIEDLFGGLEPVAPPPSLKHRLLEEIRPGSEKPAEQAQRDGHPAFAAAGAGLFINRGGDEGWESTGVDGVEIRKLFVDEEQDRMTALVRMQPGSSYPIHLHSGPEECYVLEGDLHFGEEVLQAGDYQRAEPGSLHGVQRTEGGCLLLIVASMSDEVLE